MIPFDINKLVVDHIWLKRVTTSSGGRVTVVDEDASDQDNEVYKQIPSDWSIVRRFAKVNESSQFFNPVLCAVAYYDNKMIALEKNFLGSVASDEMDMGDGSITKWKSQIEKNAELIENVTAHGEWFIDGFSIYKFNGSYEEPLSHDGRFASVPVDSYKLISMDNRTFAIIESKVCLKYTTVDGSQTAMSPPIWKLLSNVGHSELKKNGEDAGVQFVTEELKYQFDKVDNFLALNVDFALKAARELSSVFGYEVIEPLNLDYLMTELGTVNLPTVDKSIRQTFDIGIQFTHCFAWLMGLIHRTDTLEGYMAVRGVLKYMTGIGIYRKKAFEPESIYKNGQDASAIPLMSIDEAADAYQDRLSKMDFTEWSELTQIEQNRGRSGRVDTGYTGLFDGD